MGVRITGMGVSVTLKYVQDVRYSAETEVADIPIPEEDRPWLIGFGGTRITLTVVAREVVEDGALSNLIRLIRSLVSGKMMPNFTVVVEEWGISESGIVKTLEISQVAGDPNTIEVRLSILIGELI